MEGIWGTGSLGVRVEVVGGSNRSVGTGDIRCKGLWI